MMTFARLLFALAVAPTFLMAQSPEKRDLPPEFRRHRQILSRSGAPLYRFTVITKLSEAADVVIVLIRDEDHGDTVIRHRWSFENQWVVTRVSDLEDRAFLQLSYKMPLAAKNRTDAVAEARANRPLNEGELRAIVKIETNGGQWDVREEDLAGEVALRRFRHDLRITMNFALLESLERMRGTFFATSDGVPYYDKLVS